MQGVSCIAPEGQHTRVAAPFYWKVASPRSAVPPMAGDQLRISVQRLVVLYQYS